MPNNSETQTSFSDQTLFNLTGRVALVTGGASGLGLAIAKGFAAFGADVALLDLNEEASKSAADEIVASFGVKACGVGGNVVDPGAVEMAVAAAQSKLGIFDILVNSAGNNCRKPLTEMTLEDFKQVLSTHVDGTFNCTKALAPAMLENRAGTIINIASIMASVGMENISAYAAAKGAIVQFTKVTALEFADHEVRVNAIAPGFFDTPLTQQRPQKVRLKLEDMTPLKRFAHPDEIVGPAVFLASKASSFVTGTTLYCDGGWTAR